MILVAHAVRDIQDSLIERSIPNDNNSFISCLARAPSTTSGISWLYSLYLLSDNDTIISQVLYCARDVDEHVLTYVFDINYTNIKENKSREGCLD